MNRITCSEYGCPCQEATCNYTSKIEGLDAAERNDRTCTLCNQSDIGDEFHYLLKCTHFETERRNFLPALHRNNINVLCFQRIMCENDCIRLISISKFISIVFKTLRNPPGNIA